MAPISKIGTIQDVNGTTVSIDINVNIAVDSESFAQIGRFIKNYSEKPLHLRHYLANRDG